MSHMSPGPEKVDPEERKCSFCGKSQRQVAKIIAGPAVYICDECVGLCNEIISDEARDVLKKTSNADRKSFASGGGGKLARAQQLAAELGSLLAELRGVGGEGESRP